MIALAERGALFDPGPCMYMEKLAVGPAVSPSAVSIDASAKDNLRVNFVIPETANTRLAVQHYVGA